MTHSPHQHGAGGGEDYTVVLERMNRFQEPEARQAIADLQLPAGSRGLDVGCGAGLYALWLAEAIGPQGQVVAIEPSAERVAAVQRRMGERLEAGRITFRQGDGLAFRPVPGLDLAGELRVRLDRASLGQISSFAGDFDGDGRADFVQLGRGRKVTIHRGQPGARYAPAPDLVVTLEREPLDVALVAVNDLDGDGRSDLSVTQPIGGKEIGARAALDLYLSGSGVTP